MSMTIDPKTATAGLRGVCEEARATGTRLVASILVPADPDLHPSAVLLALPAGSRSLWWQDAAETVVVSSGVAATVAAASWHHPLAQQRRFGEVADGLADFQQRLRIIDPADTGLMPAVLGGFSFFSDDLWPAFGAGALVLPATAYVRRGNVAVWVVSQQIDAHTDPAGQAKAMAGALSRLAVGPAPAVEPVEGSTALGSDDRDETRDLIKQSIECIHAGEMEKVVIARTERHRVTVDIGRLTTVLARRHPGCVTFAFERSGEWFAGATPELLVRLEGTDVRSAAVAATAPRHTDPALDGLEPDALTTGKQLEEHRLVVDAIAGALDAEGVEVVIEPQRIMELRTVRHLATEIGGTGPDGVRLLELVGALHPTPAVGGVPGSGALEWIRHNEPFTRGWYAAPIGCVFANGDGEFRVALRSARIAGDGVHFYAGAGIVAGSDVDAEMEEIDLKLRVMAGAVAAAR